MDVHHLLERMKKIALNKKCEIQIHIRKDLMNDIHMENGKLSRIKNGEICDILLQVLFAKRLSVIHTTIAELNRLEKLIEQAVYFAKISNSDRCISFSHPVKSFPSMRTFDDTVLKLSLGDRIRILNLIVKAAHNYQNIVGSRSRYTDQNVSVFLINTNGFLYHYKYSIYSIRISCIAKKGSAMANTFGQQTARFYENLRPISLGKTVAQNATTLLHKVDIKSGFYPVILSPMAAKDFLYSGLAKAISGYALIEKRSFLQHLINTRVASSAVTIEDNPLDENMIGSVPIDDDGIPVQRKMIIENGLFKGFLHDTYTACKLGVKSTGNSKVDMSTGKRYILPFNLHIKSTGISTPRIISKIKTGLYILHIIGEYGIEPVAGKFNVGAIGFCIKNGIISHGFNEVTLSGSLLSLFKSIVAVGDDFIQFEEGICSPSILVNKIFVNSKNYIKYRKI